MHKKAGMLLFLCGILVIAGCETAKGMAQGAKRDMHNIFAAGGKVQKADAWVKKNLW